MRRWGVKEMSTDTTGEVTQPSYVPSSRPRVTGPAVPAARWVRRPLTGRGLESQLDSTALNDLFTVIYHNRKGGSKSGAAGQSGAHK